MRSCLRSFFFSFFFPDGRRYSADDCSVDAGRKPVTFDLQYDKRLSESIHDVHKKFHEITVYENSSPVEGKYYHSKVADLWRGGGDVDTTFF